jgi:nitric oxide reductase subunit C
MRKPVLFVALTLALALAACGQPTPAGVGQVQIGEAAAGKQVFHEISTPACGACHSLEPGKVIVGPSLAGIGTTAPYQAAGLSPAEFLHQSIIEPDADLAPGFAAQVMPTTYSVQLTEEQIADLVAFLLSLK